MILDNAFIPFKELSSGVYLIAFFVLLLKKYVLLCSILDVFAANYQRLI